MRCRTWRGLSWLVLLVLLFLASPGMALAVPILAGHTDVTSPGPVDGTINWAVWAPTGYPGPAPTGGTGSGSFDSATNFVYAYQVTNAGSNTDSITGASIGYLSLAGPSITFWGAIHNLFTDSGGPVDASNSLDGPLSSVGFSVDASAFTHVDPCQVTNTGSTIHADYVGACGSSTLVGLIPGPIPASSTATVFLFTSSLAPGTNIGSIIDIGSAQGSVPSPVPEPATLLLLGTGMVAMGAWGRGKRIRRSADR